MSGASDERDALRRENASLREELRTTRARSRATIQTLLDSLGLGVIVADAGGEFTHYNREAALLTGIEQREIPQSEWSDQYGIFEPDGVTRVPVGDLPLSQALQGNSVEDRELLLDNPWLDTPRVVSATARPLLDGSGGGVVVFSDVTERIAALREIERSNRELEDFAYVASHDLQEPLRKVANFVQLLADDYGERLDPEAHEYIRFAVDGALRMQVLIRDLLRYSRIDRGGAETESVNLVDALNSARDDLAMAIEEVGAEIVHDPLPTVRGIPGHMHQLLQNLLANALKFRGAEAPRIRVASRRQGRFWELTVADNGIGVAPRHRERVFQVFQRLHGRQEYPGTGLGLALCRRIVVHHGGKIWMEGNEAGGTSVSFTLPAVAPSAPPG